MILAVATLLFQFQAIPATISSVNNTPTISQTSSQTSVVASIAAASPAPAPKPAYVTSETESSSTRLNVASVKLVSENSKPGTLRPVSFGGTQEGQTLSTIRIPESKSLEENGIERAVNSPSRRQWIALAIIEHGAAGFDAYSTRQAVGHGAVEQDPLMRPFAGSPAIYVATQVGPVLFDLLARHMQRSEYPLIRRVWWMPQTLSAGISIFSGVHNLHVASSLQQ
jgi:hypothetical protein